MINIYTKFCWWWIIINVNCDVFLFCALTVLVSTAVRFREQLTGLTSSSIIVIADLTRILAHSFSLSLNVTDPLPFVYRGIWIVWSALKMDQSERRWTLQHSWLYCSILLCTSTKFSYLVSSLVLSRILSSPVIFSLLTSSPHRFLFPSVLFSPRISAFYLFLLFFRKLCLSCFDNVRIVTAAFVLY